MRGVKKWLAMLVAVVLVSTSTIYQLGTDMSANELNTDEISEMIENSEAPETPSDDADTSSDEDSADEEDNDSSDVVTVVGPEEENNAEDTVTEPDTVSDDKTSETEAQDDTDIDAPKEMTLEAKSASKRYDGSRLRGDVKCSESDAKILYSVDGGAWTTDVPSIINAGSISVKVKAVKKGFDEVSAEYTLTIETCKVIIKARDMTLAYGDSVYLNADVISADGDEIDDYDAETIKGLLEVNAECDDTRTLGEHAITVTGLRATEEGNYEASYENGTLTIVPQSINPFDGSGTYVNVVVSSTMDKLYNGKDQSWKPDIYEAGSISFGDDDKVSIESKRLVEGTDYKITYLDTNDKPKSNRKDVTGDIIVKIQGIGNYTGEVTRRYSIQPRMVTVVTQSASKSYDGEPLVKKDGAFVTNLADGESVTVTGTGSLTDVGTATNKYKITWDNAIESNYVIAEEILGTLTVTEADVVPPPVVIILNPQNAAAFPIVAGAAATNPAAQPYIDDARVPLDDRILEPTEPVQEQNAFNWQLPIVALAAAMLMIIILAKRRKQEE